MAAFAEFVSVERTVSSGAVFSDHDERPRCPSTLLSMDSTTDTSPADALPRVRRIEALAESRRMIEDPVGVLMEHTERLGPTYRYAFGGVREVIVTSDPAMIRHVLKDNYGNYAKSDIQTRQMKHFLGEGLLSTHGEPWLRQRRVIARGFRTQALQAAVPTMAEAMDEALLQFEAAARAGPVDLSTALTAITFPMVARSLFDARISADEVNGISHAITVVQGFMMRRVIRPYLAPWYALSGATRRHEALRDEGFASLARAIRHRRTAPPAEDMLQLLLDAVYDDGTRMTDDQVLKEVMQLLVAGHETSSNALSWTLYLLHRHPEVLYRAREEFADVVGEGPVRYEHVARLALNGAILAEALRLCPPFWMVDRHAVEADRCGATVIEAGVDVAVFLYGAHHSPRHWEDPEAFRPERFVGDDGRAHAEFVYLPFGAGPRGCVGGRYAMLQMLMVLNALLRRFRFELVSAEPVVPEPLFILRPRGGLWARVSPLSSS
jgi:cytochrome P450